MSELIDSTHSESLTSSRFLTTSNAPSTEAATYKTSQTIRSDNYSVNYLLNTSLPGQGTHCSYCHAEFNSTIECDTHILTQEHLVHKSTLAGQTTALTLPSECLLRKPNKKTRYLDSDDWSKCLMCGTVLQFVAAKMSHRCMDVFGDQLRKLYSKCRLHGLALYCLLCDAKPMRSRVELTCHLIAIHAENADNGVCSICHCQFRSRSRYQKELHMLAQHAGPMQLAETRCLDQQHLLPSDGTINLSQCKPFSCVFRSDVDTTSPSPTCGTSSSNLAHFTLHILTHHCAPSTTRLSHLLPPMQQPMSLSGSRHESYSKNSPKTSLPPPPEISCHLCRLSFPHEPDLDSHIKKQHAPNFKRSLYYHICRGHFDDPLDSRNICLLCFRLFDTSLAKQIHMFMTHCTPNWRQCGLCGSQLVTEAADSPGRRTLTENIIQRILNTHERLHIQHITSLIHSPSTATVQEPVKPAEPSNELLMTPTANVAQSKFSTVISHISSREYLSHRLSHPEFLPLMDISLNLVKSPSLITGTYVPQHPIEQQIHERDHSKNIFSKEMKRYFIQIGNKNRKIQEKLELFG